MKTPFITIDSFISSKIYIFLDLIMTTLQVWTANTVCTALLSVYYSFLALPFAEAFTLSSND